jgi:hypothetical protein
VASCLLAAASPAGAHEAGTDPHDAPAFLAGDSARPDRGPVLFWFVPPPLAGVADGWAQTLLGRGIGALLALCEPLEWWLDDIRSR